MILTSGVGDSIRLFFRHGSLFGRSFLARPAFGLRHERFYLRPPDQFSSCYFQTLKPTLPD